MIAQVSPSTSKICAISSSLAAKRVGDPAPMVQGLAWSQDGRLAFLSDAESHGQMQLYVVDKPGRGKPRKIGNFEGYVADPHWSPDGKSIAVL